MPQNRPIRPREISKNQIQKLESVVTDFFPPAEFLNTLVVTRRTNLDHAAGFQSDTSPP
jgi:hypothetical protein